MSDSHDSSVTVEDNELENLNNDIDEATRKSYIIRGIISMMLVVAGAVLLVIVILAGCEKKPKKSNNKWGAL